MDEKKREVKQNPEVKQDPLVHEALLLVDGVETLEMDLLKRIDTNSLFMPEVLFDADNRAAVAAKKQWKELFDEKQYIEQYHELESAYVKARNLHLRQLTEETLKSYKAIEKQYLVARNDLVLLLKAINSGSTGHFEGVKDWLNDVLKSAKQTTNELFVLDDLRSLGTSAAALATGAGALGFLYSIFSTISDTGELGNEAKQAEENPTFVTFAVKIRRLNQTINQAYQNTGIFGTSAADAYAIMERQVDTPVAGALFTFDELRENLVWILLGSEDGLSRKSEVAQKLMRHTQNLKRPENLAEISERIDRFVLRSLDQRIEQLNDGWGPSFLGKTSVIVGNVILAILLLSGVIPLLMKAITGTFFFHYVDFAKSPRSYPIIEQLERFRERIIDLRDRITVEARRKEALQHESKANEQDRKVSQQLDRSSTDEVKQALLEHPSVNESAVAESSGISSESQRRRLFADRHGTLDFNYAKALETEAKSPGHLAEIFAYMPYSGTDDTFKSFFEHKYNITTSEAFEKLKQNKRQLTTAMNAFKDYLQFMIRVRQLSYEELSKSDSGFARFVAGSKLRISTNKAWTKFLSDPMSVLALPQLFIQYTKTQVQEQKEEDLKADIDWENDSNGLILQKLGGRNFDQLDDYFKEFLQTQNHNKTEWNTNRRWILYGEGEQLINGFKASTQYHAYQKSSASEEKQSQSLT